MTSVGETLRRERLRAGLDLEKIAQDTKIAVRTLELIESDQFEKLPGSVFARSFVRQYARVVGLDADEMVANLNKVLVPPLVPEVRQQEMRREPEIRLRRVPRGSASSRFRSSSALSSLALMVLAMLACSGAYMLWLKSSRKAPTAAEITRADAVAAKQAPAAAVSAPPAEAGPTTPERPAQAVSGTITTDSSSGSLNIALTAEEPTWVRATANGKVVFSGVIQPNETRALSAGETVTLRIGNAGGLAISLNGKSIPAVGPKGQVRIVQLSRDGAVQVEPPAKSQPAAEQKTQTL
jgi:cytoskeletal protein RodZ